MYVVQLANGTLAPHTVADAAALYVETTVNAPVAVAVSTALFKLREQARTKTLDEYAALCGVPRADIEELAHEFTSHGKRAVADAHGGTMSGAGFYTAYAIAMLNTLVGNLNVRATPSSSTPK